MKHKNQFSLKSITWKLAAGAAAAYAFVPLSASATEQCGTTTVGTPGLGALCGNGGGSDIYMLIQGIANWVLGLIAVAAVLVIVVSGIQYITSQGDPGAIKSAKSRLVNAVVGLIVLALMFVILKLIGVST